MSAEVHTFLGYPVPDTATTLGDMEKHPTTSPDIHSDPAREADLVDVRDMVVVHTALLREFRLAPDVVAGVRPGDHGRTRQVDDHLELICGLMHHHHTGEDELLWPVLAPRLAPTQAAELAAAEAQHAGLEDALNAVHTVRSSWTNAADEGTRDHLAQSLTTLHQLLAEHLEFEERQLLPLAAAHLTHQEWHAIGEAGARSVGRRHLLLVMGMFAYEGDPGVVAQMLSSAPPPVRYLVPRLGARAYARYANKIHGSRHP